MPDVVNGAFFHFSFLVRLSGITSNGNNPKGAKEGEKRFIEADKGTFTLNDSAFHIIMDEFLRAAAKKTKSIQQAAMQGLLALRVGKSISDCGKALDDSKHKRFLRFVVRMDPIVPNERSRLLPELIRTVITHFYRVARILRTLSFTMYITIKANTMCR